MKTRLQRWGNSLALRIPKSFALEAGLEQNSPVEVSLVDGRLIITPAKIPQFTLDELIDQVREDNLHDEVDSGPARGGEAW